jgi:putative tryptophan/tyrosine transport system substrate-binding protein
VALLVPLPFISRRRAIRDRDVKPSVGVVIWLTCQLLIGDSAVERRAFVIVLTLNLLATGASWAQEPAKIARVGIVTGGGNPRSAAFFVSFEERLRELGWVAGKNLSIDFEGGDSPAQLSAIATRMVQNRVDVLVAVGPERALKAASEATQTIPIVSVALNYDPVDKGYVTSLARSGRNITGIFVRNPEIGPKQLELLHQALPRANRVGVLWTEFSADQIAPLDAQASRLGVRLEKVKLVPPYDIEAAFASLKAQRVDAVLAVGDPVIYRERVRVAKAGLERGIAVVGGPAYVDAGTLIGFGSNLNSALRRCAEYVDKILRGAKAAEMPIEQPTKFELTINLKTARALGLTIPQSLLLRADEVIQ